VRFRQVESFALSNLQEFGLAEPAARGGAKRLDIGWRPTAMAQGQGRRLLAAHVAGQVVSSDAVDPDRVTTPRRRCLGMQVEAGGIWIPRCHPADIGFLCGIEPLLRGPGWGGVSTPAATRDGGELSHAIGRITSVLLASAPSHVDCF
jgi:hypothetical protein